MKKILLGAFCALTSFAFAQTLFPANGAVDSPYDSQLVLTFDGEPAVAEDTVVEIFDASGNLVDTIAAFDEKQSFIDGTTINVGSQLIRKEGYSVFVTPHNSKLLPSSSYTVKYPGIETWSFTTKAAPSITENTTLTVNNSTAADNKADFHSIQAALDAVSGLNGTTTLSLAASNYYEVLHYSGTANIVIQGPKGNKRGNNCVISYINCNDLNKPEKERVSFYFDGSKADLILENVTFHNLADSEKVYSSAVKTPSGNAQAETLLFKNGKGHHVTAYNSSFKSRQDTLQLSGKCWFYDCYIEGDVDYIWGYVDTALFENCELNCIRYVKDRAYLFECRVGLKEENLCPKGMVLLNSTVNVAENQTVFLARRATDITKAKTNYYDQCAVINTKFAGPGNFSPMYFYVGKTPQFEEDSSNIGWKFYNIDFKGLKGNTPATNKNPRITRYKDSAEITKKLYKAEYANRDLIMNRVFNKSTGKYEADAAIWDLKKLAKERGYKVK